MRQRFPALKLVPAFLALGSLIVLSALLLRPAASQPMTASATEAVRPVYDDDGQFLLPEDWRRWVFVGSSLGLSYSEGGGGTEMFHETLVEPSAYEHFTRTGEFPDGTMIALLLHNTGEQALPQRQGRFAGDLAGLEMAVKDSRAAETWSYYGFGGRGGLRDRAEAIDAGACNGCHTEHAVHDNVFVQFYPLLASTAPAGTVFRSNTGVETRLASAEPESAMDSGEQLALGGLDPVLLTDGHAELGKAEIVMTHGDLTYRFVSEPTRKRFESDPPRYAAQNTTCPVVSGAPVDPQLFSVHEGRIYLFASEQCVTDFQQDPERYLSADASGQEVAQSRD